MPPSPDAPLIQNINSKIGVNMSIQFFLLLLWVLMYSKSFFFLAKVLTYFAVTAKLISAFVFATGIVQLLYFLNPKFPASSHLLCLYRSVCRVKPGPKPQYWFSRGTAHIEWAGFHNFYINIHSRLFLVAVENSSRLSQPEIQLLDNIIKTCCRYIYHTSHPETTNMTTNTTTNITTNTTTNTTDQPMQMKSIRNNRE